MNGRLLSGELLVLALLLSLMTPALAAPDEAHGVVTNVVDGDTFEVQDFGIVRLADVDCPEMGTAKGKEAKNFTEKMLLKKMVYLDVDNKTGKDQYDRWICVVYLEDGTNFNKLLVDEDYAVVKDYSNNEFDPLTWWPTTPGKNTQPGVSVPPSSALVIKEVYPKGKEEYVVIQNNGKTRVNLGGWKLKDQKGYEGNQNHIYSFPQNFTLAAGASVKVHTKEGTDTATDLYWGGGEQYIWNDKGDTAYLFDPSGNLVDKYSYLRWR